MVQCAMFQIWIKKEEEREIEEREIPKNFKFVKKNENPDFSIRRVGVYAGKLDIDIDKSIQSHYFIKIIKGNKSKFSRQFNSIKFESNNTVGPKSISKPELIQNLNKLIF